MTLDRALRILRANLTQTRFSLRARREDWDRYTMIMMVDSRRVTYVSARNESDPIPIVFKGIYDPYAPLQSRWTFVTDWTPTADDLSMDWDVWTS